MNRRDPNDLDELCEVYRQNFQRGRYLAEVGPVMRRTIGRAIERFGADSVGLAMLEAIDYNVLSWSYVYKVLLRAERDGVMPGELAPTKAQRSRFSTIIQS